VAGRVNHLSQDELLLDLDACFWNGYA